MTEPDDLGYTGVDGTVRAVLAEIEDVLGPLNQRLVLIGGMAFNYWCEPRYTAALDFVVAADPDVVDKLVSELTARGYNSTRIQGAGQPSGIDFVRLTDPSGRKIVEFQTAKTDYQELLIKRGIAAEAQVPVRIATPEDLIVLKLIAGRSKDYPDALALAQMENLDWPYIEEWAATWEVEDRLQRLRDLLNLDS
jgi:hypothetical protein